MTYTGWVLLPMGVVALLAPTRLVYALLVFFAAFSATAILNVGEGESASGVQAWMFFGFIWVLRECGAFAYRLRTPFPGSVRYPLLYLATFVLVAAGSLLMPLWIDGHLQIMSPFLLDFTTTPLYFASKNVTAFAYLLFGATIAFLVARSNLNDSHVRFSIRVYLASGTFIAVWGLLQYACFVLNVTYPHEIFNNSLTPSATGYTAQFEELGVTRISSVAVEASILAQVLLTVLPFTLPALLGRGCFFSRVIDRLCFVIILVALVLTASTTAYLGIVLLAGLVCAYLLRVGTIKVRQLPLVAVGGLVGLFGLYSAYVASAAFRGIVNELLLSKSAGYSALERLKTIRYAQQYFQQYPVIGIGWGSAGSHDMIFKILSNTGVLGLLAYAAFLISVVTRLYKGAKLAKSASAVPIEILVMLAILIQTLTDIATGFSYVFGHFWFICGLAMVGMYRQNRQPTPAFGGV